MDYQKWGSEYLFEAQNLKRHLMPLRRELEHVSGENEILLYRRISILQAMYLECLHTGRYLTEKGGKH